MRLNRLFKPFAAALMMIAATGQAPSQEPAPPAAPSASPAASPVEEFVAKAEALLIADDNYDAKSTAHYKVKTDDPRFNVAAAADLLESFRQFFDSFWSSRTELRPYDEPSRILLFFSRYKYKQLMPGSLDVGATTRVGHYQPYFDIVALHTDTVGPEDFPELLVHEAAHQLVTRRIFGPDDYPSPWVSEGLADYMGNTLRGADGKFQPGRIGGKGTSLFKGSKGSSKRMGWPEVRAYRASLKKEDALTIDEVVRTSNPDAFYDASSIERYTASWLLVHFLLHADGGSHSEAFIRHLRHDAAGEGGAEMLYRDLGMSREQLDSSFRAYIKDLAP
ncbi:MAG TPA: hypothetical protein VFG76_06515 [Candidatus Polarisedimenticolia bacterium]|nr:hypothetical protein [Candidatus Polarisedimenticolia bacterium]